MRTEAIFELRRQLPDLSDGAFILLAFIAFRVDGSRFVDDAGAKYIFLSGNNDPAVALGWTNGKVKRMKKDEEGTPSRRSDLHNKGRIRSTIPHIFEPLIRLKFEPYEI